MAEIVWTLGATVDYQQLFSRFEEHRAGAGIRFTEEVEARLAMLAVFPHLGPVYEVPFRRLLVFGHEYGLFYTAEARGIIVHALLHNRQDPDAIRRRLLGE